MAALDQLELTSMTLEQDAPLRLALLRAESGLKLPDCCVLLAAEQTHAALATFDEPLSTAARQRELVVKGAGEP